MTWPVDLRPALLAVARNSIATALGAASSQAGEITDQPCHGAFVTLHKRDVLRGCIGTFASSSSTIETIREMAQAAALRDPRFSALTVDELDQCHIEISLLGALQEFEAAAVVVGRHGLCISRGFQRGVLLPQVATDNSWDREMFLRQTCHKAGLPPETWRDADCRIEVFEATVFGE